MKKILIGLMMMAGLSLSAQTLLNPGFENWNPASTYAPDTVPNQWYAMYCNTVHPTTDAYHGSYATRIQGYFACGIAPGIMVNGQQPAGYGNIIEGGTPFSAKPAVINGYYKYTEVAPGDSAEVTVILKKFNMATMHYDTVGLGIQALAASSSYTLFSVQMNYLLPALIPDSIIIMFNSSKYYMWDEITMALPSLYIDRIMLPEANVTEITENKEAGLQSTVYPNPMNEQSTLLIKSDISGMKNVMLSIYDAAGRKVSSVEISANSIPLSGLSPGNYLYLVSSPEKVLANGKIVVQ